MLVRIINIMGNPAGHHVLRSESKVNLWNPHKQEPQTYLTVGQTNLNCPDHGDHV